MRCVFYNYSLTVVFTFEPFELDFSSTYTLGVLLNCVMQRDEQEIYESTCATEYAGHMNTMYTVILSDHK